jgi:hypothetical protein
MASWAALSTVALRFLEGDIVSHPSTVRFVAHQGHFQFLDVVDQELPKATGQHVFCFLVAPIPMLGIKIWP